MGKGQGHHIINETGGILLQFLLHVQGELLCKFSTLVNRRGLMLLLLLGADVSLNPDPLTLDVLNARCRRYKGTLFVVIVASKDLDILCLTKTHVHPFDSDSFYNLLHLPISHFLKGLVPPVLVVLVFSLDPPTNHRK